jgi:hypothetical protein
MPILPFPSFHQPLWLLPLLLLPLLWWWLRQRDRQPLTVAFPATRLLLNFINLVPRARPPIWRRVLQLLLLASLMVALAQPYWPSRRPPIANQPTLLVIDNGWLAGQHWGSLQQAAITLLDQLPADQPVYVISTTSLAAPLPSLGQQPIAVEEAKAMIRRWQPNSWPIDPGFAEHLKAQPWWYQLGQVWWLTGSMQDQASKNVMGNLEASLPMGGRLRPLLVGRQQAVLTGLTPLASLNSLTSPTSPTDTALPANAIKPEGWLVQLNSSGGSQRQELQLLDEDGQLLAQQQVTLVGGAQTIPLLAPTPQLAKASQLRLVGQRHPGAVWLLPVGASHAGVGLIGEAASLQSRPPLSQAAHYLTQALQPSPPVMADVAALLAEGGGNPIPAMMLWPEDQILNAEERTALTAWVSRGGVLLRLGVSVDSNDGSYGSLSFGDRAQSNNGVITDALLPVRLLAEPRRFGGLLTPQVQQRVRAAANSPVADLADLADSDLAIQQAWLSLPDVEQASETWLSLPDGSPLLSARPLGQGWLLLLHVPATPNWSDLPMSALFPQLLQRLAMFAGQQPAVRGMVAMPAHGQSLAGEKNAAAGVDLAANLVAEKAASPATVKVPEKTAGLMAWRQLDGYGRLVPAQSHSQALPLDKPTAVTYDHPPGYYGMAGSARPLNPDWQTAGLQMQEGESWLTIPETNLTRPCLLLALALLTLLGLCDAFGRRLRFYSSLYTSPPAKPGAQSGVQPLPALSPTKSWLGRFGKKLLMLLAVMVPALMAINQPLHAQPATQPATSFAEAPSLAYVIGNDARLNRLCDTGLSELSGVMAMRTSLTLGAPVGLDMTKPAVQAVVGRYPMLYWLVPTGDGAVTPALLQGLRRYIALGGLLVIDLGQRGNAPLPAAWADAMALPPLAAMPADHVLTRSFYLLRQLDGQPGLSDTLLLARAAAGMEVAPALLARRNWVAAWSEASLGDMQAKGDGEMAIRSGINLVIYAFTGQYKADQVHMPAIMQRLGQPLPVPLIDDSNADKTRDGTVDRDMPKIFRNPFDPNALPISPNEDAP